MHNPINLTDLIHQLVRGGDEESTIRELRSRIGDKVGEVFYVPYPEEILKVRQHRDELVAERENLKAQIEALKTMSD